MSTASGPTADGDVGRMAVVRITGTEFRPSDGRIGMQRRDHPGPIQAQHHQGRLVSGVDLRLSHDGERQLAPEGRSLAWSAVHPDAAAVLGDDAARDIEP